MVVSGTTARLICSTFRSVISSLLPLIEGPMRVPAWGVTMMLSPTVERLSEIASTRLLPRIPMDAMATTPMMIPITARSDRNQWSRTFLTAKSKNNLLCTLYHRSSFLPDLLFL